MGASVLVIVRGGLGNQLFIAAAAQWIEHKHKIRPILVSANPDARPGRYTRATQFQKIDRSATVIPDGIGGGIDRLARSVRIGEALHGVRVKPHRFVFPHHWSWNTTRRAMEASLEYSWLPIWDGFFHYYEVCCGLPPLTHQAWRRNLAAALGEIKDHLDQLGYEADRDCVVHIRLGDYRTYGIATLPPGYYVNALHVLRSQGFAGRIFLISDDLDDAARLMDKAGEVISPVAIEDPLVAMALIGNTRYKIVANSTLSLWGAILGRSDQSVTYPANWLLADVCKRLGWLGVADAAGHDAGRVVASGSRVP